MGTRTWQRQAIASKTSQPLPHCHTLPHTLSHLKFLSGLISPPGESSISVPSQNRSPPEAALASLQAPSTPEVALSYPARFSCDPARPQGCFRLCLHGDPRPQHPDNRNGQVHFKCLCCTRGGRSGDEKKSRERALALTQLSWGHTTSKGDADARPPGKRCDVIKGPVQGRPIDRRVCSFSNNDPCGPPALRWSRKTPTGSKSCLTHRPFAGN